MGNGSRWFRLESDWWETEWAICLSAEARLCFILFLGRVASVGLHGILEKSPVSLLARQWLVGEESIRQMFTAAVMGGEVNEDETKWEVVDKTVFAQDPTATARKRAQREREKESRMSRDVTDVTTHNSTEQYITNPPIVPPGGGRRARFVKPTDIEVAAFAKEIGLSGSRAKEFWLHYESNGWKVGKVGMSDWHAAMHKWKNRDENPTGSGTNGRPAAKKLPSLREALGGADRA